MIHQRDWFQQISVGVALFVAYLGWEEYDLRFGSSGVEKARLDRYMEERGKRLHNEHLAEHDAHSLMHTDKEMLH